MTEQNGPGTPGPPTVSLTRQLDAPREAVYESWTDGELFQRWWGPEGYHTPAESVEMDAVVGGGFRARIVSDEDGSSVPFAGVFHELVKNERVVFGLLDLNDETNPEELTTITLTDKDGGTELVFTQETSLPPERHDELREGWSSFFNRLAAHLAAA
jgi:uncharacterized protein YndB with AHSA1/START domain